MYPCNQWIPIFKNDQCCVLHWLTLTSDKCFSSPLKVEALQLYSYLSHHMTNILSRFAYNSPTSIVSKRYYIPKLCYCCKSIQKKKNNTLYYYSMWCTLNHSIYYADPLPDIPTMDGDEYENLKLNGEGVYVIHKRVKLVLPEENKSCSDCKSPTSASGSTDLDEDQHISSSSSHHEKKCESSSSHSSSSSKKKKSEVKKTELLYDQMIWWKFCKCLAKSSQIVQKSGTLFEKI